MNYDMASTLTDLASNLIKTSQIVEALLLKSDKLSPHMNDIFAGMVLTVKMWNKQLHQLAPIRDSRMEQAMDKVNQLLPTLITIMVMKQLDDMPTKNP